MSSHNADVNAIIGGQLLAGGGTRLSVKVENYWNFQNWRRPEGCNCPGCQIWRRRDTELDDTCLNRYLAWAELNPNIVVTVGLNDLLTQYFKGSAYTAAWSIGLVDGAVAPTYAAADTMASHAGWTENTGYSQATRVSWVGGTASAGSIDNSGSTATFSMNATSTIAGGFFTTNSTKGGTTGTLYGEANFTQGNRSVVSGDTLIVTVTLTAS